MIPKVIHYCWFGGKEMPPMLKMCMASWKKHLPDYEIKQWDESNFDVNMAPLCREAYAARKWAFVADYCRVYALYTMGGVYMDTDILVLKNFDEFLKYSFCSAQEYQPWIFESVKKQYIDEEGRCLQKEQYVPGFGIQSGIMMAEKGTPFMKDCMDFYNSLHLPKNLMDIVVVKILAKQMEKYGYRYTIHEQYLEPYNMFVAAPSVFSNMTTLSGESYAWHMYYRGWGSRFSTKQVLRNSFPKLYTLFQLLYKRKFSTIPKVLNLK